MNKVAHYLQEHISGEIVDSSDVRRHFSTDASIFSITPSVVLYPRNENDLRKTTKFTWQLAERGRVFPITARGFWNGQKRRSNWKWNFNGFPSAHESSA